MKIAYDHMAFKKGVSLNFVICSTWESGLSVIRNPKKPIHYFEIPCQPLFFPPIPERGEREKKPQLSRGFSGSAAEYEGRYVHILE